MRSCNWTQDQINIAIAEACKAVAESSFDAQTLVCREIHAHILSRAEWWRTNPDDSHGINKAVFVAMREVANAINSALALRESNRELNAKHASGISKRKEAKE